MQFNVTDSDRAANLRPLVELWVRLRTKELAKLRESQKPRKRKTKHLPAGVGAAGLSG